MVHYPKFEINAKTDLAFDDEEIKTGRKVTALRFLITKNTRTDISDALRDDSRLARLKSHGMAEDAARALVQDHEPELVECEQPPTLLAASRARRKSTTPPDGSGRPSRRIGDHKPTLFAQEQAYARETERDAEQEREELEADGEQTQGRQCPRESRHHGIHRRATRRRAANPRTELPGSPRRNRHGHCCRAVQGWEDVVRRSGLYGGRQSATYLQSVKYSHYFMYFHELPET